MIDIHSHLLPGVDDGAASIEASVPVLRRFAESGVECVVLTPHLRASCASAAPVGRHRSILDALRAAAPASPELRLGWEIMLDVPGVDLTGDSLGLGGSRAVLVEFPRAAVPVASTGELRRLRASGVVPVVAHPERYRGCSPRTVREWRSAGAVIQMDSAGLLGSGRVGTACRALLAEGLVDLFASDNHGDSRSLATARTWLSEAATPEHVELLTRENARRLLSNEPTLRVPPLRRLTGMLSRLQALLHRA